MFTLNFIAHWVIHKHSLLSFNNSHKKRRFHWRMELCKGWTMDWRFIAIKWWERSREKWTMLTKSCKNTLWNHLTLCLMNFTQRINVSVTSKNSLRRLNHSLFSHSNQKQKSVLKEPSIASYSLMNWEKVAQCCKEMAWWYSNLLEWHVFKNGKAKHQNKAAWFRDKVSNKWRHSRRNNNQVLI